MLYAVPRLHRRHGSGSEPRNVGPRRSILFLDVAETGVASQPMPTVGNPTPAGGIASRSTSPTLKSVFGRECDRSSVIPPLACLGSCVRSEMDSEEPKHQRGDQNPSALDPPHFVFSMLVVHLPSPTLISQAPRLAQDTPTPSSQTDLPHQRRSSNMRVPPNP